MEVKRYYSVKELAEGLEIHQRSVYRMIASGSLKADKLSGVWYIPAGEVSRLLNVRGTQVPARLGILGKARQAATQEKLLETVFELGRELSVDRLAKLVAFADELHVEQFRES